MTWHDNRNDLDHNDHHPVKILVLEDDDAHVELIRRGFSGCRDSIVLTIAMTLGAAREQILKDPPDLILADWLLPDGKGAELITSSHGVPEIPVVIMTSHGSEQIAVDVMKSGAIDYVVKSETTFTEMPHISTRALHQWRTMRDHARAEAALASAMERLKEAQSLAHIGTWDWIVETDMVNWSEELYHIAGRDPSQPAPTYAEHPHLYTPDSWGRLSRAVSEALTTGEPYNLELEMVRLDGSTRWINAFGGVKRDRTGKITGLLGTLQDVTDRKLAEEKLRESEEHYHMLFSTIDEGFCIIEVIFDGTEKPIDYCFLEINPAFEKQTGLIDAKGKRMRELAPLHEEHWFEIYGNIAVTGRPARFVNRAEQLHRWYDVYAFRFGRPELRQVAILFNDITKRKKAEEEIQKSLIQIERDLEQMALFNDQIRNPLAVMVALLDREQESPVNTRLREQVYKINDLITTLDRQYCGSEKVHEFLRKHHDFYRGDVK